MSRFTLLILSILTCLWPFIGPVYAAESGSQPVIWAIRGDAVTLDGVKKGWTILEGKKIAAVGVGESEIPAGARKIEHDGYIYPGLIDTHNHVGWNVIPKWSGISYASRYDWQIDPSYLEAVNMPYYNVIVERGLLGEATKYSEIRALTGGTTLIQSTYAKTQPELLIKNLDDHYLAQAYTGNIRELPLSSGGELYKHFLDGLADKSIKRLFLHIGEGRPADAVCADELNVLKRLGLTKPGVVVIHGMALNAADYKLMQASGMYLVWSPRSNWNLYHATTDIAAARAANLTIALAPDWTISGSDNLLEEMKFAAAIKGKELTSEDIFRMSTIDAAKVAGVDNVGKLEKDCAADLFLAPHLAEKRKAPADGSKLTEESKPFDSLLRTYPRDIKLVFVDGRPIYGDAEEMAKITTDFDVFTVDGRKKGIITTGADMAGQNAERLNDIEKTLRENFPKLAPVLEN